MNPDLKIPLRRLCKTDGSRYRAYYDLVRKHGTSRKKMVEFICSIGGYPQSRCQPGSAVSFNIKAYNADLSEENLWKLLCSQDMDVGPSPSLSPEELTAVKSMFSGVYAEHRESLWQWGVEEAYEGWADSDIPYETFTGLRVDWRWEIMGRSGGHLGMTECSGISLTCSTDDLEERLLEREGGDNTAYAVPHASVRDLFIICVQNTVDLSPANIREEVEYRAAWRLWVSFCEDEQESVLESSRTRDSLSDTAGTIAGMLEDRGHMQSDDYTDTHRSDLLRDFKTLCLLAGVKIGE